MPTCGYICPQCEGRGFTEEGETCDWCNNPEPSLERQTCAKSEEISDEEWQRSVHEGKCCAD